MTPRQQPEPPDGHVGQMLRNKASALLRCSLLPPLGLSTDFVAIMQAYWYVARVGLELAFCTRRPTPLADKANADQAPVCSTWPVLGTVERRVPG